MRLLALSATLLLMLGTSIGHARPHQYRIDIFSADSWARYYERIGLGTVLQGPIPRDDWQALAAHCEFLEDGTGHTWIPLGYSIERGYKLCFRTSPFSLQEAHVLCARLLMHVLANDGDQIVCGGRLAGRDYERLNPYLRHR